MKRLQNPWSDTAAVRAEVSRKVHKAGSLSSSATAVLFALGAGKTDVVQVGLGLRRRRANDCDGEMMLWHSIIGVGALPGRRPTSALLTPQLMMRTRVLMSDCANVWIYSRVDWSHCDLW